MLVRCFSLGGELGLSSPRKVCADCVVVYFLIELHVTVYNKGEKRREVMNMDNVRSSVFDVTNHALSNPLVREGHQLFRGQGFGAIPGGDE